MTPNDIRSGEGIRTGRYMIGESNGLHRQELELSIIEVVVPRRRNFK